VLHVQQGWKPSIGYVGKPWARGIAVPLSAGPARLVLTAQMLRVSEWQSCRASANKGAQGPGVNFTYDMQAIFKTANLA
jgi:hypothetical protein